MRDGGVVIASHASGEESEAEREAESKRERGIEGGEGREHILKRMN